MARSARGSLAVPLPPQAGDDRKLVSTGYAYWRLSRVEAPRRTVGTTDRASPTNTDAGAGPSSYGARMSSEPTRVLVVAHRTAATPRLLDAVRERARRGPCAFTLLVPRPYWDPDTEEAAATLELAIPLLDRATATHVRGVIGTTDPFEAVRDALARERYDEAIVSTLPLHVSRWLRHDLPHRIEQLGLPVTVVTAERSERDVAARGGPSPGRLG